MAWVAHSRQEKSGTSEPALRITKAGDVMLRHLLVGSAQYILGPFGPDSDLRRWGLKLAAVGGKNAKKRGGRGGAEARGPAAPAVEYWRSVRTTAPGHEKSGGGNYGGVITEVPGPNTRRKEPGANQADDRTQPPSSGDCDLRLRLAGSLSDSSASSWTDPNMHRATQLAYRVRMEAWRVGRDFSGSPSQATTLALTERLSHGSLRGQ